MTLSITFTKKHWGMKFHLAIRTENPINPAKDHTQLWANNWRSKSFKIFNFSSGIFYYRLFHREHNWGWTHTACFSLGYFVSESKEWRGFRNRGHTRMMRANGEMWNFSAETFDFAGVSFYYYSESLFRCLRHIRIK